MKGGQRYLLTIPSQASSLEVSLNLPDATRGPTWQLSLTEFQEVTWQAETERLWLNGKQKELLERLTQLRRTAPRKEQGLIFRMLAYVAQRDGNDEEQEEFLRQGLSADRAENCVSCEVEKATWLARFYLDQGRFSEARETLEKLRLPPETPAESKYLVAYYQGLLADGVGDYRSALNQLRKAASLEERVGLEDYNGFAEQVLARLYQDLGRSEDADSLFERLQADAGKDCDQATFLTNWAWSRLMAREGGAEAKDPTPMLEEAKAIYDSQPCARAEQRLNAGLNLAFAHQQVKRWREARQALEQVRALTPKANLSQILWWFDLEGRAAIAERHPARALHLYEQLKEMAERALSVEGRFRASLGRARAQKDLGHRAAALASLAEADSLLDEQSWHVPAHEGRETFVGQREEATRMYLGLLLEEGQQQSAFALARRARSRLLRQLTVRDRLPQLNREEQVGWDRAVARYRALRNDIDAEAARDWQLSINQKLRARENRKSQLAQALEGLDRAVASLGNLGTGGESRLAPPRPGEVVLAYHPLPQGWVGFAAHEQGIEVSTFGLPSSALTDKEALGRILLEPFHRILERAERVRVLPYGPLQSVDFHALPFGGEPSLLAWHSVVYSLDLSASSASAPPAPGRRGALLVADPQGNLPAARQEAEAIDAVIRTWKPIWALRRLSTDAQAKDVAEALPTVSLFHYAGHGTFGGFAGWDSVLTLADDSRLTPGDILALPQAPAWVMLAACDAARTSSEQAPESIGLAQAFLLAGSQAVVAANRPVDDHIARDLMSELYRGWRPGVDLARQFQRAQQICSQRHPAADCASFRLLVP